MNPQTPNRAGYEKKHKGRTRAKYDKTAKRRAEGKIRSNKKRPQFRPEDYNA